MFSRYLEEARTSGGDTIYGSAGSDTITGGDGNDRLEGLGSNDRLDGEGGADTLVDTSGADTLIGGAGDDRLFSSIGSDTFVYSSGDGNDFIDEQDGSTTSVDVLHLLDLNAADVTLSRTGSDLFISITATGHMIEIDEHFYSTSSNYGIEQVRFADGTIWSRADISGFVT